MANLIQTSRFWKDVDGFEGIYQVSTSGVIRALPRIIGPATTGSFLCLYGNPEKIVDRFVFL